MCLQQPLAEIHGNLRISLETYLGTCGRCVRVAVGKSVLKVKRRGICVHVDKGTWKERVTVLGNMAIIASIFYDLL